MMEPAEMLRTSLESVGIAVLVTVFSSVQQVLRRLGRVEVRLGFIEGRLTRAGETAGDHWHRHAPPPGARASERPDSGKGGGAAPLAIGAPGASSPVCLEKKP